MKSGKCFLSAWLAIVTLMGTLVPIKAAPLFVEDWDSGPIDTAIWDIRNSGGSGDGAVGRKDYGGADSAIYTKGPTTYQNNDWDYSFISKQTFTRGNNLRATFKAWGDPSLPTWAGAFPSNGAITGPWHNINTAVNDIYSSIEAGPAGWASLPMEFMDRGWFAPPHNALSTAFITAFNAAISKATGILYRVTLGNVQGGKFEWSTDGVNWTTEFDTRNDAGAFANTTLYVGFGTHAGAVAIDDIIVEDDNNLVPVELSDFSVE